MLAVAFLYSCVGHAGASGYIAVMTLWGLAPAVIKPMALTLNILVAVIASLQFWRAGHFSWKLFWPLALSSVPCAFLGGYLDIPIHAFNIVTGLVLLASAVRFFLCPPTETIVKPPALKVALGIGSALGFLSGLTGTGGGIFLTPLGIFLRWERTKTISAVSAAFILVNSASGLMGYLGRVGTLPGIFPALAFAALAGGVVGASLGSTRLPHTAIKRLLALILAIAGGKLLFA